MTNAFLPALRRSAHPRIVNISSGTGSLTWGTGPQFPHRAAFAAYRSSKAALNALTVFYAHALADDGIKVNALAPGLRRTDLNAHAAASGGDPAEAGGGRRPAGAAARRRPHRGVLLLGRHPGPVVGEAALRGPSAAEIGTCARPHSGLPEYVSESPGPLPRLPPSVHGYGGLSAVRSA